MKEQSVKKKKKNAIEYLGCGNDACAFKIKRKNIYYRYSSSESYMPFGTQ